MTSYLLLGRFPFKGLYGQHKQMREGKLVKKYKKTNEKQTRESFGFSLVLGIARKKGDGFITSLSSVRPASEEFESLIVRRQTLDLNLRGELPESSLCSSHNVSI